MTWCHCLSRLSGFLLLTTIVVHFTGEPGMPCPLNINSTDNEGMTFKAPAECLSLANRLLGFRQTRRAKFFDEASLGASQSYKNIIHCALYPRPERRGFTAR